MYEYVSHAFYSPGPAPYDMYRVPDRAFARIKGSSLAPNLKGFVVFTDVSGGTEVYVEVHGLPPHQPGTAGRQPIGPHGFHIHTNGSCQVGDPANPFQAAGEHWNPTNQPHGNHPGDFPVLFSNNGYARMNFFTNRFRTADVIGKSVVIHQNPDDYRTHLPATRGKESDVV